LDNPFADIEKAFQKAEEPKQTTKGKAPPEKQPDKAPEKPPEQTKDEYKGVPAKFRQEYETVKSQLKAKDEAVSSMEAKIRDYEAKGKDTAALAAKLEKLEKDAEELRAENALLKDEPDEEFVKTYEKPFQRAADWAKIVVEKLNVVDETGTPVRKADWKSDFVPIYNQNASDPGGALEQAEKLFGKSAKFVMDHVSKLEELDRNKTLAEQERKATAKQRLAERTTTAAQRAEKIREVEQRVDSDLLQSVDDYRDPPDDKELAEARSKAYSIIDSQPKTFEQYVLKNRHIRHMAAAHFPLKLKLTRLQKELEETKAELSKFKNPQPGELHKPGGEETETAESFEEGLRKAVQ
jgi:hypothetical protein